ncbi:acyl-CoA dehydrogenase [Desulfosporosinus sp. HMP52]|uniref:acyl-CoA dehydrogenase family protein n=1 Tax=Desulfosporosinus sp. HMP52 TaxID=1487923 RepID=UPI00051F9B38|nr:acyl-CoA dehydrogenase family protein [Desulfosporosinus sp. HMP52]KGK85054.1 acyl-CoA dehydrogenase [Desulfosporosinus sp. HMP52]
MDFSLTEEQETMRVTARKFVDKEILPVILEYDEKEEFPLEIVNKMHEVGLLTIGVPEEFDGPGADILTQILVTEELSRGCGGIGATMAASCLLSAQPVNVAGTYEQKKYYYDRLNAGKLGAFCLTEPGAGSDTAGISLTAKRDGDFYVLNGTKQFITNGGVADIYTVFGTTNKELRYKGIIGFIVDRNTPGISVGPEEKKMGIRTSDTRQVIFEDVRVPVANRLGEEGEGFKILMKALDLSRPSVAAEAVGIAQGAYEAAVKYCKERVAFGQEIGKFQAIRFMLADMAMEIEAARLLTYKACYLAQENLPFSHVASYAKCFAADVAMKVTTNVVQILGGYGYLREYGVEKYMRDAKVMQIYEGTNQIQRVVIANNIFK